jgi:hypothetical protein
LERLWIVLWLFGTRPLFLFIGSIIYAEIYERIRGDNRLCADSCASSIDSIPTFDGVRLGRHAATLAQASVCRQQVR